MKCKKHPCELGEGVCASCLRERLLALAREQSGGDRRRAGFPSSFSSSPQPAPVAFPRSVSPRASRRHDFRFFSTPQVGPTFGGEEESGRIRRSGRFSVFRTLFGDRRSKEPERNWVVRSGSWFSALVRRRKKQPQISSAEGEARLRHRRRAGQVVEKGMSPAAEDNRTDASGYSSESSNGRCRPNSTPMRRTVTGSRNQHHHHHVHQTELGSVSGFAVFLSPLKRVGTTTRRTQVVDWRVSPSNRTAQRNPSTNIAMPAPESMPPDWVRVRRETSPVMGESYYDFAPIRRQFFSAGPNDARSAFECLSHFG